MPLSRRDFAHLVALSALTAKAGFGRPSAPAGNAIVRLGANENPYGPSPAAVDAMRGALSLAARYPDDEVDALTAAVARVHGVPAGQVLLGDGSSEILKIAAAAFTSPGRRLVMAEPSFEAIEHHARAAGADTVKVPLDANYAHDLLKMAAVENAGVIYVCNPNNPTGSITPKQRVRAFLEAVPPATIVVVDEAYHHYVESSDYESVIPLIASHPNLIVARTFSKIYAMAGVRAGYAVAQRELISLLDAQQQWDSMNVVALTGARASLGDADQVTTGRRRNSETRRSTVAVLGRLGYGVIPSETNFIMIDTRRHVKPLIGSLREKGVRVGRLFPAMPHHLRVTIGTPQEMERFVETFRLVTA